MKSLPFTPALKNARASTTSSDAGTLVRTPENNRSVWSVISQPQSLTFMTVRACLLIVVFISGVNAEEPQPQKWSVPVAGNIYRTSPDPFFRDSRRKESIAWSDREEVFSLYFHVDRPCRLSLSLEARSTDGVAQVEATVANKTLSTSIKGADFTNHDLGDVEIEVPGYVRVDLQGMQMAGDNFGEIKALVVNSSTDSLKLSCVASNKGNMFYWGRRGPSVHLGYVLPQDVDLEYAYSEIMVAKGDDPLGSYFMANGFREGYFGIQVNSDRERRVLFSVWSPFQTDNPRDIPEDQRVALLARGPEVKTGEFGNEGSGGQSFLVYPWEAGRTYRFLTQVRPDGNGNTIYTSWFGDKQTDQWRLIASFRRPKTNTHLKGFHSFLENFNPQTGHLSRRGQHQNIWVCDTSGNWHECLSARFSVDATGGGGHRLDFTGGADGDKFFLRNCGFIAQTGVAGTRFTRTSSAQDRPQIDWTQLPRE